MDTAEVQGLVVIDGLVEKGGGGGGGGSNVHLRKSSSLSVYEFCTKQLPQGKQT